jgi:glycosyltransferase involved in cell wall biosynthesis
MQLVVDSRWSGNFGIGRYSRELCSRLSFQNITYISGLNPTRMSEIVRGATLFKSNEVIYSPGYIPQISRSRQIITLHDLILLKSGIGGRSEQIYFRTILRTLINKANIKLLTVSEHSRTEIADWLKIDRLKIDVIHNGISSELHSFGKFDYEPDRGNKVMFIGNPKKHKNFQLFIDAINCLSETWEIILVGNGLDTQKIDRKHKIYSYQDIGDGELASLYLRANVLVVPSLYEGFCMPVLEGSYLGCKVVDFGVLPTIKEIIGEATFKCQMNSKSLAFCIEDAARSQPKLLEQDRLNLPNRFSWDSSASRLNELISTYE